ncbi:hypothetical protein KIPB_014416, partial [Kipferlia bialata]
PHDQEALDAKYIELQASLAEKPILGGVDLGRTEAEAETVMRMFLLATKLDIQNTRTRMASYTSFRRNFCANTTGINDIKPSQKWFTMYLLPEPDLQGRPVMFMKMDKLPKDMKV